MRPALMAGVRLQILSAIVNQRNIAFPRDDLAGTSLLYPLPGAVDGSRRLEGVASSYGPLNHYYVSSRGSPGQLGWGSKRERRYLNVVLASFIPPREPVSQPAGTKRWMHGCTAPIFFCTGTPSRPLCDLVILHFGFELDRAA